MVYYAVDVGTNNVLSNIALYSTCYKLIVLNIGQVVLSNINSCGLIYLLSKNIERLGKNKTDFFTKI
jgi:hypothetical protein